MTVQYNRRINPLKPVPTERLPEELNKRLGSGIATTFLLDDNMWDLRSGIGKVKQDMYVVLCTPVGRRLGQPDFGSLLPYLIFEPYTGVLQLELRQATEKALQIWVPQIVVNRTEITNDPVTSNDNSGNTVVIIVFFTVKGTNSTNTLVLNLRMNDSVQIPPETYTISGDPIFPNRGLP